MKKVTLTIATVLFMSGLSMAAVPTGDDTNKSEHQVTVTIPKVAIIDIEAANGEATSITLTDETLLSNLEAGDAIDFSNVRNSELWLNYTSISGKNEKREIKVSLDSELPSGINIRLTAATSKGSTGIAGTPDENGILLKETEQGLISGIGTVFTGNGVNNGHQLTFQLEVDKTKYAEIVAGPINRTVYYTITGETEIK